ncbi:MAG: nuclear transport factor 2 family protein [Methylobacteriaceae bacterium]|nr:nuclear transport factor 2 family protein [Methylobacteriaceae bacterium]
MDPLMRLTAKSEIEDVLFRYARAVDRKDWPALADVFHADAHDDHGEFSGGPTAFVEWVSQRHAAIPFAMHIMANCLIEFVNDATAAVETYFVAIQRREKASASGAVEGTDVEVFGRYCDRFEKRDGAWRVARRTVVYDGTRMQPSTHHLRKLVGVMGRRDKSDPVYALTELNRGQEGRR